MRAAAGGRRIRGIPGILGAAGQSECLLVDLASFVSIQCCVVQGSQCGTLALSNSIGRDFLRRRRRKAAVLPHQSHDGLNVILSSYLTLVWFALANFLQATSGELKVGRHLLRSPLFGFYQATEDLLVDGFKFDRGVPGEDCFFLMVV